MNSPVNYNTPVPVSRRLSLRTAAVGGIIAGAVTFGSTFVLGPLLYLGVGLIAGVTISAIAARASYGFEFRAGFLASGFAAASAFVTSALCAPLLGGGVMSRRDPLGSALIFVLWWALFAVPGLLGSLWFWEGRQPRKCDNAPPEGK